MRGFERYLKVVITAVLLALLTLGAFALIRSTQNAHIRAEVDTNARLFSSKLDGHLRARFMVVDLFVEQLEKMGFPMDEHFALNAPSMNRLLSDLQALNWVDATGTIRVVTPGDGNEAALGLDLTTLALPAQALQAARETNGLHASAPLTLAQGGYGFVTYVPVVRNEALAGYLNLVFKTTPLIESVLGPRQAEEIVVAVRDGDLDVYGDPTQLVDDPFAMSSTYHVKGRDWTITVAPRPALVGGTQNLVDEGVLIFGLVFSVCIASLSFVGQRRKEIIEDREERFALAMKGASDGLYDHNRLTGEIYFSPRWFSVLGYGATELPHAYETFTERVHPDDLPGVLARSDAAERNGETNLELGFRMRHKDGSWKFIRSRAFIVYKRGRIARTIGTHIDVTDVHNRELALEHAARTDHLTGLRNRRGMDEELQSILGSLGRGERLAMLHLDLDRFKSINDTDGHQAGDHAVKAVSYRLKQIEMDFALIARVGGDEFLLIDKRQASDAEVLERSNMVISRISEPFEYSGKQYRLSASVGISFSTKADSFDLQESAVNSDIALKSAKRAGGGRSVIFEPSMRESAVRTATVLNEIEHGIARGEFCAHFQPQVDLKSREITGFEALVRWNHPQRGLLSACHFLPFVAQSRLARRIDALVLEQACDAVDLLSGTLARNATVSVNLSNEVLSEADVADVIMDQVARRRIAPKKLGFEVLETTLLSERNGIIVDNVTRLAAEGFRIELDDFGTGHSAISSVLDFPVSQIKIDRSLITKVSSDARLQAVVSTILDLGKKLDVNVLAEGIESAPELDFLAASGCLRGQGFLIGKPMPVGDLLGWIGAWKGKTDTLEQGVRKSADDSGRSRALSGKKRPSARPDRAVAAGRVTAM